jgi:hypothetical protein
MFVRFRKAGWRLKVSVVQSARRGGKVVQETVAYLGSIDARALMAPDDEHEHASVAARVAFWEGVNPRLKSLVNRLGGVAEVKRLRMAIHARIPWPMRRNAIASLSSMQNVKRSSGTSSMTARRRRLRPRKS